MPVSVMIVQVALLRHHVAHCAGFRCRQFLLVDCGCDRLEDLRFRASSYYQLGLFDRAWKIRACRRSVKAERSTQFRIPEFRIVDSSSPRSFHEAYETVLALNRAFITTSAEDHDLGIAGDGVRRSAPRQLDLRVAIRHQVLLERGHARIQYFGVLSPCFPHRTEHDDQSDTP